MAVAAAVVSVSMGVMKPVLSKLSILMGNKYKKIKGLRKKVAFLHRELSDMDALLEKMDNTDELDDPQAQNWRKDIIEMSYDIEDCIDDFMHHVGEADDKIGLLKKPFQYLKTFKDRHHLANQFQDMQTRVMEASERRKRYMLDQGISMTTHVAVDSRLTALYKESTSLVGIDAQKDELVNWAMDNVEQLKVMAIVGHGGLGKTTLANEVYREVGEKYNCKSFISVSQRLEMIGLLNSMVSQFGLSMNSHAYHVTNLINNIRRHLQDKRYLVIVDDLWDVSSWDIIKCVFPENGKQSRVIVTTRHQNVAMSSCSSGRKGNVHNMKPLSEEDSRKLFNNRIFGPEGFCPPQFIDVSCEILKKCGGLPLAIITVASILACRPTRLKEEWEQIQDCLLASQAPTNSTLTDMMHILDLSYKFLPRQLKACFLYLIIYPEDHKIERDELVRKWVAGGFVSGPVKRSVWDVAESYLNELVNRSMIQLAYRDYVFITKPYYKVHDMVLDLILKRCRENNFIRLLHDPQAKAELQDKVRRLTVHTAADVTIDRQLSQVHSLSLFRASCVPSLSKLRFLRVLFLLGFPTDGETIDLTCVTQLSQLRYLKVARDTSYRFGPKCHVVLPNQVRSMHRLETLEIEYLHVLCIPPDIVHLPCLSHLSVGNFMMLPDGICKVKTLRILRSFRLPADSSGIVIESFGDLTNLGELSLSCRLEGPTMGCIPMTTAWMAAWSSSLLKLSNLRKLCVDSYPYSCCADAQMSSWVSPPFPVLEELDVAGWTFSRIPRWFGGLHNLHKLRFGVKEVSNLTWDDIGMIGMLPNLITLHLRVEGDVPAEGIVIGSSTGFKLLQQFYLHIKNTSHRLAFEAGAMPNLRELRLTVDPKECNRATAPVGLGHLASLQVITVFGAKGYRQTLSQNEEDSFEAFCAMFEDAITGLPTQPAFHSSDTIVHRPWDEEYTTT